MKSELHVYFLNKPHKFENELTIKLYEQSNTRFGLATTVYD